MSNATASNEMTEEQAAALLAELEGGETETETEAVSYTHLTLPTKA